MKYYTELIESRLDMEAMNFILNEALRDPEVTIQDYKYLETVAKSLGFIFADDFTLF
jgi:hypothetical protein